jgi:hypothetical protein
MHACVKLRATVKHHADTAALAAAAAGAAKNQSPKTKHQISHLIIKHHCSYISHP